MKITEPGDEGAIDSPLQIKFQGEVGSTLLDRPHVHLDTHRAINPAIHMDVPLTRPAWRYYEIDLVPTAMVAGP